MAAHKFEEDRLYRHFIERIRLGAVHKAFLYSLTALLWGSGLVWVLFHYFGVTRGDYGDVRSSWEPFSLKVHGAAAMGFLLVLGSLVSTHMRRGWALKRNRVSGSVVAAACAALIVSGWILYYLATERVRAGVSLLHWSLGLALPVIVYVHIVAGRRKRAPAVPVASLK